MKNFCEIYREVERVTSLGHAKSTRHESCLAKLSSLIGIESILSIEEGLIVVQGSKDKFKSHNMAMKLSLKLNRHIIVEGETLNVYSRDKVTNQMPTNIEFQNLGLPIKKKIAAKKVA